MQTLIDSAGAFALPTGWHEVSTAQFCATDPLQTVEARASYFAGRPIQVNGLVADALEWMLTPPEVAPGLIAFTNRDLGQETYLQVEIIRAMLAARPLHECMADILGAAYSRYYWHSVFSQERAAKFATLVLDWPISQVYPAVTHCLAELQRLATKYAELAEPDPTEAARRAREAGSDELLGLFGHYNTAKAVAQQMGITLDEAYALPYESVCVHLLHERRLAILQDTIQRNAQRNDHT